jgi:chaperone required for assembly of F1-ATPase
LSTRFWTTAYATEEADGWSVRLDGKPLRLPSGAPLRLPGRALADAVAAEWQAAASSFTAADVPLTGLAGSAQERVRPQRDAMIDTLARYAENDLLCYRVDYPAALVAAQDAQWQPWLDWAANRYGAPLLVTNGIAHIAQPSASLAALRAALAAWQPEAIAALGLAIPALGSCVLGLALAERAIGPDAALQTALLHEVFAQARWGADPDNEARRAHLRADIELAARFMELCRPNNGEIVA